MDPLVPNQVRYQTAPHSDKFHIIARTNARSAAPWPFFCRASGLRKAYPPPDQSFTYAYSTELALMPLSGEPGSMTKTVDKYWGHVTQITDRKVISRVKSCLKAYRQNCTPGLNSVSSISATEDFTQQPAQKLPTKAGAVHARHPAAAAEDRAAGCRPPGAAAMSRH